MRVAARAAGIAVGFTLLLATGPAASVDCSALPTSALRARPCDPRKECLDAIPKEVKGARADARRQECNRLPTRGVCHGPETYDPQAECWQQRKR
jgi:hypothetical protein